MMTSRQALLIFQLWVVSEFEDAKRNLTRTFGIRHQTYNFCKYDEYSCCPRDSFGKVTCDCNTHKFKQEIVYLDLQHFYCNKLQLALQRRPLKYKILNDICKDEVA